MLNTNTRSLIQKGSILSAGIPAKSLTLRVRSTASIATAVTPMAISAGRFRGEPRIRKTSDEIDAEVLRERNDSILKKK